MIHGMDQRLTFVRRTGERSADGHLMAEYRCTCGGKLTAIESRVRNGYTRSCGCLSKEAGERNKTHGLKGTPAYRSWTAMRTRCLNPRSKDYPRWGGAGITVCAEWADFEVFLSDMGARPAGTTLDRVDPAKGYFPGNCRWATPKQQARNRRDVVLVRTDRGIEKLPDVADRMGITRGAALMRLKRGKLEGACHVS